MVPAWVMICRTDKLWLLSVAECIYILICFFVSHKKKISQILERLARKKNTLEQNGLATVATWLTQRESITHNSNFS